MSVHTWVYRWRKNNKSAVCGSKPASWLFLFSKKFAAGLPTGKPAGNFSKIKTIKKVLPLLAWTHARWRWQKQMQERRALAVLWAVTCAASFFCSWISHSSIHRACVFWTQLFPLFIIEVKQKNCDSFRQVQQRQWRRRRSSASLLSSKRPWR